MLVPLLRGNKGASLDDMAVLWVVIVVNELFLRRFIYVLHTEFR